MSGSNVKEPFRILQCTLHPNPKTASIDVWHTGNSHEWDVGSFNGPGIASREAAMYTFINRESFSNKTA